MRIGVFVCHCGINIASVVSIDKVVSALKTYPGIAYVTDYKYMCSDPGQNLLKEIVKEQKLDKVIVAACSPSLHEMTFRRASSSVGMNPYLCEMANIREQCSWVHRDEKEKATDKAISIIKSVIAKIKEDESLFPIPIPMVKRVLVIGAGISGITAAQDIANSGYEVILAEKGPKIGGHVLNLYKTYPDFEHVTIPELHPKIKLITNAHIDEVDGYLGNFKVKIKGVEENVGAIIVATGFSLYKKESIGEYGYGKIPDVINSLQYEELLNKDELRRPSDGKIPKEVVFIQCVGSRDPEKGVPYCSKICCMYTAKHAFLYKDKVPDGQAYVFYIDIRSGGKDFEEFVQKGIEEKQVLYLKGKVSKVFQEGDKVVVWGADTLIGKQIEIAADMVVLAPAMLPGEGSAELAKKLKIAVNPFGFYTEAHPKMRPVESLTSGIYLAGCGQAPKDIPESITQASAAASKVLSLFSQNVVLHEPLVVSVDPDLCKGCGLCVSVCPYNAREIDERRKIAKVNEVLCQGCGACVVACPNNACMQKNYSLGQVMAMVDAML